jgi:hypothetical protein
MKTYGTRLQNRFIIGWRKQGSDALPQQRITWKSWLSPDYVLTTLGVRSSPVWIITRSRLACYRRFGTANRFNNICVATRLTISGKGRDFLYSKMSILVLGPTQSAIRRVSPGDIRIVKVAGALEAILPLLTFDYEGFLKTTLRSTWSPPAQQNAWSCVSLVWVLKIFYNLCLEDQRYGAW